jgi:hypothetical protein
MVVWPVLVVNCRNSSQTHVIQEQDSRGDNEGGPQKQRGGFENWNKKGDMAVAFFLLLWLSSLLVFSFSLRAGLLYLYMPGCHHMAQKMAPSSYKLATPEEGDSIFLSPLPPLPCVYMNFRIALWLDQEDRASSGSCEHFWRTGSWQLWECIVCYRKKSRGRSLLGKPKI